MYNAQKSDHTPGDFYQLVKGDIEVIGGEISEEHIQQTSKNALKREIKEKIKVAAFRFLRNLQEKHSKVKDIHYKKLETQAYMTSPIFKDEEVNLLHALRSRYINVKANFR